MPGYEDYIATSSYYKYKVLKPPLKLHDPLLPSVPSSRLSTVPSTTLSVKLFYLTILDQSFGDQNQDFFTTTIAYFPILPDYY